MGIAGAGHLVGGAKFPSGIVANCTSSYATGLNRFWAGAEGGWFEVDPALNYTGIRGRKSSPQGPVDFGLQPVDHFAAEMDAFSSCILENRPTTVPGEEGRRDQKIMAAIYESAETGRAIAL